MIDLARTNNIATITLARPEKHNAIDLATTHAMRKIAHELEHDQDTRVIVLAAQGASFSVGGDIAEFYAQRATIASHLGAMTDALHAAVLSLRRAPAPVIASINGVAAGGGLGLALLGDLVIAKRSAKFVSAYTRIGLSPDTGVSYHLPRKVGPGRAFDLMVTNRTLTADEAFALDLIERVVADDDLAPETQKLAQQLADMPSRGPSAVKQLQTAHELAGLEAHLAREATQIARIATDPETLAKLERFLKGDGIK
ncbi:MAG TPA: enoyl-CoA hydratase/isomerase family protein [Kofleriaceae bacterium]